MNLSRFKSLSSKGFTLIELLIVVAIMGVLAAGVLVAINPVKKINQAKDSRIKSDIGQIAQAQQAYFTMNQSYALTVADLVTAGELKTSPLTPAGTAYSISAATSGSAACTTAGGNCAEVIIYTTLNDAAANTFYCWASATGAVKTSAAGATAPTATATTCP